MIGKLIDRHRWGKNARPSPLTKESWRNLILEPYTYVPLPTESSIRVCILEPGAGNEPLRCSLITVDLDKDDGEVLYDALSYTWSWDDKLGSIECDGFPIGITDNLFSALVRIRYSKPQVIWADAICINQARNPEALQERARQVRMMWRIFGRAQNVIVDLGHPDRDADVALKLMEKAVKATQKGDSLSPFPFGKKGFPSVNDKDWRSYLQFMTRRYFSRVWVCQEFALAICTDLAGEKILARTFFLDDKSLELHRTSNVGVTLFTVMHGVRQMVERADPPRMAELLTFSRFFDSTDPRDRVFALVGLAQDGGSIGVDYEIDTATVFTRTASYLVDDGRLNMVTREAGGSGRLSGAPSWVPDFSQRYPSGIFSTWSCEPKPPFAAGIRWDNDVSVTNNGQLRMRGTIVDRVVRISDVCAVRNQAMGLPIVHLADMEALDSWVSQALVLMQDCECIDHISDSDRETAFLQTLVAGIFDHKREMMTDPIFHEGSTGFMRGWSATIQAGSPPFERAMMRNERFNAPYHAPEYVYLEGAISAAAGKRFCVTQMGRLGLVPAETECGDVIALASEVEMPLLLRPQDEGSGLHEFLGCCYINGTMDGEALPDIEDDLIELKLV